MLAGAVGGGVEESFGLASILHGRLHGLNARVGVPRDGAEYFFSRVRAYRHVARDESLFVGPSV